MKRKNRYGDAIMMVRSQIMLESETQKRARRRASEMGVSFAEYIRRAVERDLASPEKKVDVSQIFERDGVARQHLR